VAHDARVTEEPLDLAFAEARDALGLEVRESGTEAVALA
jgi:hypothetical protein